MSDLGDAFKAGLVIAVFAGLLLATLANMVGLVGFY